MKKVGGLFTRSALALMAFAALPLSAAELAHRWSFNNDYLIDFTTAFEIKTGNFIIYHTGDSGRGTEPKLGTTRGRPDLWLFFPGCGVNTAKAVEKVNAKRIVFGHLWELGHLQGHRGRLDERDIRPRLAAAKTAGCEDVSVAFWGDRII